MLKGYSRLLVYVLNFVHHNIIKKAGK